jgi:hypothetical protein
VAVKVRIMGLPGEISQVLKALLSAKDLDVIEVSGPYRNRGDSRIVRVYAEARLRDPAEDKGPR